MSKHVYHRFRDAFASADIDSISSLIPAYVNVANLDEELLYQFSMWIRMSEQLCTWFKTNKLNMDDFIDWYLPCLEVVTSNLHLVKDQYFESFLG